MAGVAVRSLPSQVKRNPAPLRTWFTKASLKQARQVPSGRLTLGETIPADPASRSIPANAWEAA